MSGDTTPPQVSPSGPATAPDLAAPVQARGVAFTGADVAELVGIALALIVGGLVLHGIRGPRRGGSGAG